MVDNELNGELSRPKITRKRDTRQSTAPEPPNAAHKHVLVKIGKTPLAVIVQLHCAMCKKKASATCSGSGRVYLREWQAHVLHRPLQRRVH
jgi:hypothetical protein